MAMEVMDWRSMVTCPSDYVMHQEMLSHQRRMAEAGYNRHGHLEVKVDDRPEHQAYLLRIGPRMLVVPYRLIECPGTTVVGEDPYIMPSRYTAAPAEIRKQEKPKEKTDLCSTHIYTRR